MLPLQIVARTVFSILCYPSNWHMTLSPWMVDCWTLSTDGISDALEAVPSRIAVQRPSFPSLTERPSSIDGTGLSPAQVKKTGTSRPRRRTPLNNFRKPRKNSIGLHLQNVAGSPRIRNAAQHVLVTFGSVKQGKLLTCFFYTKHGSLWVSQQLRKRRTTSHIDLWTIPDARFGRSPRALVEERLFMMSSCPYSSSVILLIDY